VHDVCTMALVFSGSIYLACSRRGMLSQEKEGVEKILKVSL
jgi:hypothetical protein